jgi:hypothetical protein
LIRIVPGTTDAALTPDIASLNNAGPGLPNYTTAVLSPVKGTGTSVDFGNRTLYSYFALRLVTG